MVRRYTQFPLVADNEVLLGPNPTMDLYEESDLISNIRGPYQEKEFGGAGQGDVGAIEASTIQREEDLLPPLFKPTATAYSRKDRLHTYSKPQQATRKTEGQLAREAAREDLKRKRSADYLKTEKPSPAKIIKKPSQALPSEEKGSKLSRLAERLRQTDYILADMPAVYSLKKEDREQTASARQKNSYDFLKKSQVYNYPERKVQQERQLAQELNLTHIEEGYNG